MYINDQCSPCQEQDEEIVIAGAINRPQETRIIQTDLIVEEIHRGQ